MPALAVLAGAALLLWPALWNGYPLLFSDTGAFLAQSLVPLMIWDKPYVYGPFLHLFHWRMTLWLPAIAQAAMVSHLLWLTARCLRGAASPPLHLALCALAAIGTTAPFTVALLMPDVFTAPVLLCLFLLGFAVDRLRRWEAWYCGVLATIGIAAHLSHLPLAGALLVLVLAWTRRLAPVLRVAAPLLAAVLLLLATNAVGHGRLSLSPHGATFLLARLQADGPAAATLGERCPGAGWDLCAFTGRLPMDSDDFLWLPGSPLNRDAAGRPRGFGGMLLSAEAGEIVAATLAARPLAVALALARNTLRQLFLVRAGDTVGAEHLGANVRDRIAAFFPPRELAAYDAARQVRGQLPPVAQALTPLHLAVLIAALPLALLAARRGEALHAAFLAAIFLGLLANAFAGGALSKPHHRYQARLAWLLPVAVALVLMPRPARR